MIYGMFVGSAIFASSNTYRNYNGRVMLPLNTA